MEIHGLAEMETLFWILYLAVQPLSTHYDLTGLSTELLKRTCMIFLFFNVNEDEYLLQSIKMEFEYLVVKQTFPHI